MIGRKPGRAYPLVFDDNDQALEITLAQLSSSIRENGALVDAVSLITDSLAEVEPAY